MSAVVVARGLTKNWGATRALDGADFEISRGVTGLVGANGAGKTTLLGMVLGLHRPDAGTIEVLGHDPWTFGPSVRARVGYAPEHDALPPDMSAHDVVRHLAEVHGLPRRAATERASDVLFEVGLGEERFRQVGTFSTGQRQRVKLAQAIAHDPELVLLDEPTNGLDPVQREEMLHLIGRVGHALGIDVVLSSHLLEEVERVSDAVVILDAGRVVASGRLNQLRAGTEDELVVSLDDGSAAAVVARLQERGVAAVAEGDTVIVALEAPVVYDLVRDALADSGAALRRMAPRTSSLEDVFLAAGHAE
ncbi:MAG TPA: ABC transporter ATP-binding protein [Acidimicrobiales bacterium]|nr:ABC transporter ATP-binding protein [Acidimicrobiales bacterium]